MGKPDNQEFLICRCAVNGVRPPDAAAFDVTVFAYSVLFGGGV